jgi:hypothetical protein
MEAPTTVAEQPTKEVPLHKAAENALRAAGHPNPTFWHMFLHPHALDEKLDFDVRRFLINRAFEMTIGGLDPKLVFSEKVAQDYARDQLDARYCLLPQGDQKTWLHSFAQKVVPFIMKYQLGATQQVQAA